jgi:hypothetical protein
MSKRQDDAESRSDAWIESELASSDFKDARHGKRLRKLLGQLADQVGGSIPWASRDWANTQAAYRFFSNPRVSEEQILGGHFQATQERIAAAGALILMLHDTTEFTFRRSDVASVGIVTKSYVRKDKQGRPLHSTVCGMLMHSSLAVTREGLPLGLVAIKFWTRDEFKGCNALKKKINPTRVPIEVKESYRWLANVRQSTALSQHPERCVHIGDRESDIYELFCAAQEAGTHFLVRTCVDRLAGDGSGTIADEMKHAPVQGLHRIEVRNKQGKVSKAVLEIRYCRLLVLPPIGKQQKYPKLILTVIHAQERGKPPGRDRINWKLLTDLPVRSRRDAVEKLEWYAQRWKIGVSSQGHINQSVKVRPGLKDSGLVAGEAPWRESKTVKPSDNMLRKEHAQLTRLQRAVNADVASLHANPVAETVDNVRKQQGLSETSPMRQLSPAGYQRRHGGKADVSTGEALDARRRNLVEEVTAITARGKCRHRHQGDGSGRSTADGRAAKRARREGPGPVSIPLVKVRQR